MPAEINNLKNILTKDQATALIKLLDNCRQYDGKACRFCRMDVCQVECKMRMLEEKEIIRPSGE